MNEGTVYFFTGLSGAGKTTLGSLFFAHLKAQKPNAVFFDGDVLRSTTDKDVDYSTEARRSSAFRMFELCRLLASQGIDVVCCSISMYEDVRAWNRANITNYKEIYVRVTMDTLYRRDQKQLYSAGTQVVGKDLPWDEPQRADVVVQNDGDTPPEELVAHIELALGMGAGAVGKITPMKKGMTNRSYLFSAGGQRYILRIPGEGTDKLIDRAGEAAVYGAVSPTGIPDQVVCMDPVSGLKITRYWEDARSCNVHREEDLCRCMALLRKLHGSGLTVPREFDLFGTIDFYESLWEGRPSRYGDYQETKAQVCALKPRLEALVTRHTLAHIDPVPANFLFIPDGKGGEALHIIDWEYAAMQDPDVDIAMFAVSDLPELKDADHLIDLYYPEGCPRETRIKIHGYIAACGLLWSNWCEYKSQLGVEFGDYAQQQYRCAKDYAALALRELEA